MLPFTLKEQMQKYKKDRKSSFLVFKETKEKIETQRKERKKKLDDDM